MFFVEYLVYILVFHKLANLDLRPLYLGVQARFWQQPNLIVFLWAAVGLHAIATTQIFASKPPAAAQKKSHTATSQTPAARQLLLALICVPLALIHLFVHFPYFDQSGNSAFYQVGYSIVQSFPSDSLVLLNGDLNHNIIKYAHSCEDVRPDLRLISLQLMTWEWFVPMHAHNYKNVTFPGNRYHPNMKGGFGIKQFLDANWKTFQGKLFLCGNWKDYDFSNYKTVGPKGEATELYYNEIPFGMCNLLVLGDAQKALGKRLPSMLRQGWSGMPDYHSLPKFSAWKYGDDSWEHVLYHDHFIRLLWMASWTSFASNQPGADYALIELAYELHEEVENYESEIVALRPIDPVHYRSAGIVYGMYSRAMDHIGDTARAAELSRKMYFAWKKYVSGKTDDAEIKGFVLKKTNPYTGKPVPLDGDNAE